MTETGAGAVTSTAGGPRHVGQRCIGRAAPDMDYRIVDDAGADVARGTAGELLVRQKGEAPRRGFFTEYLKDEAATARGLGRRLVPHRRRGERRRRRLAVLRRRPAEEEEQRAPLGREHRGDRGRGRARQSRRHCGCRGRAGAGRDARRGGVRPDRAARNPARCARGCRAHRTRLRRAPRLLQGAGACAPLSNAIPITPTQKPLQAAAPSRRWQQRRSARPARSTCAPSIAPPARNRLPLV